MEVFTKCPKACVLSYQTDYIPFKTVFPAIHFCIVKMPFVCIHIYPQIPNSEFLKKFFYLHSSQKRPLRRDAKIKSKQQLQHRFWLTRYVADPTDRLFGVLTKVSAPNISPDVLLHQKLSSASFNQFFFIFLIK